MEHLPTWSTWGVLLLPPKAAQVRYLWLRVSNPMVWTFTVRLLEQRLSNHNIFFWKQKIIISFFFGNGPIKLKEQPMQPLKTLKPFELPQSHECYWSVCKKTWESFVFKNRCDWIMCPGSSSTLYLHPSTVHGSPAIKTPCATFLAFPWNTLSWYFSHPLVPSSCSCFLLMIAGELWNFPLAIIIACTFFFLAECLLTTFQWGAKVRWMNFPL